MDTYYPKNKGVRILRGEEGHVVKDIQRMHGEGNSEEVQQTSRQTTRGQPFVESADRSEDGGVRILVEGRVDDAADDDGVAVEPRVIVDAERVTADELSFATFASRAA